MIRYSRMTPLASESSRVSRSASSNPSDPVHISPQSLPADAPSQASQSPLPPTFNVLPVPPAEVGVSSLATETQLREAATGKDRMFLLLLSREIEGFIARAVQGEQQTITVPQGTMSSSILASLGPAMVLSTATTSKYQRMLVYKAAEWYGLKGVAGPDGAIFIGVLGSLDDKR